jgi:hypothetical protein
MRRLALVSVEANVRNPGDAEAAGPRIDAPDPPTGARSTDAGRVFDGEGE